MLQLFIISDQGRQQASLLHHSIVLTVYIMKAFISQSNNLELNWFPVKCPVCMNNQQIKTMQCKSKPQVLPIIPSQTFMHFQSLQVSCFLPGHFFYSLEYEMYNV